MAARTAEEKRELWNKLNSAGALKPCQQCGGNSFSLYEGYSIQTLHMNPETNVVLEGGMDAVVTVVFTCDQCGYLVQFAHGPLGLHPSLDRGKHAPR